MEQSLWAPILLILTPSVPVGCPACLHLTAFSSHLGLLCCPDEKCRDPRPLGTTLVYAFTPLTLTVTRDEMLSVSPLVYRQGAGAQTYGGLCPKSHSWQVAETMFQPGCLSPSSTHCQHVPVSLSSYHDYDTSNGTTLFTCLDIGSQDSNGCRCCAVASRRCSRLSAGISSSLSHPKVQGWG